MRRQNRMAPLFPTASRNSSDYNTRKVFSNNFNSSQNSLKSIQISRKQTNFQQKKEFVNISELFFSISQITIKKCFTSEKKIHLNPMSFTIQIDHITPYSKG